MMKKILFFIPTLGQGGAEKVLVNLVNNLDKNKYDVTVQVLFDGGVNRQFLHPYVKYKAVFKRSFKANCKILSLFSPQYLHKKFIREKYDIEVAYLEGIAARIISGCPNADTKLISWIHVEQHTKECASYAFKSYEEAQKCYDRYDRTICVSNYVLNDFSNIFQTKNLQVLYNTVDTDEILKKSREPADKIMKQDGWTNIIAVGSLKKSKGFDKLIRIHKKLLEQGIKQRVYILGRGPEKERLEKDIKDNKLEDTFMLLGYDTNPYKYVSDCDLFVCSSEAEGFSTAVTESLVVGTPVVTTLCSGMEELLGENNEYGIITENNEAALYEGIKRILTDSNLLNMYAQRAKERGNVFSKEKTVKAVEEMFDSILEEE